MSKLNETKLAYDRLKTMLDQQLLAKDSDARKVRECQAALNVAFYMLGWAQFEYLSRKEAEDRIEVEARAKTLHGGAWRYVREHIKAFSVRRKLEVIFFGDQSTLNQLYKDYEIRNQAAHDYKKLPTEVSDVSAWLEHLEELVNKF